MGGKWAVLKGSFLFVENYHSVKQFQQFNRVIFKVCNNAVFITNFYNFTSNKNTMLSLRNWSYPVWFVSTCTFNFFVKAWYKCCIFAGNMCLLTKNWQNPEWS